MRRLYFIFSIFTTTLLLTLPLLTTVPAFCAEPVASATPAPQATPTNKADTKPQIITDEKTNTVRVFIGGKEVLTIDAKGLHVHGDLDYSGIITDTGEAPP